MMIKMTARFCLWALILLSWAPISFAQEAMVDQCSILFEEKGECPKETCRLACFGDIDFPGCKATCKLKDCVELSAANCPLDACQVLKGCEDKDICYYKLTSEEPECGTLAYSGDKECCPGFVKRCGVEFFDRSCDMIGKYSIYGVAICIPCGNGICNQFENFCNCPEDCE